MPNTVRRSVVDRFWEKVDTSGDCWEWTAYKNQRGYGQVALPGKNGGAILAHRLSAMIHFGMFDSRLCVLHACDNPACVRPEHLRLGDRKRNAEDCTTRGRHPNQRKTECKHGHPFTPENTRLNRRGGRVCRECSRLTNAARRRSITK